MAVRVMRIIAGKAKGRHLKSPRGMGTRPMMDRAKEALFSALEGRVAGSAVLDLYAGSGSLGLEALSRGAVTAVFVERSRPALESLRANVGAVGLGGEVVAGDVEEYQLRRQGDFDLAFVDPPYALPLASVERILGLLDLRLSPGATAVLHRRVGGEPPSLPPRLVVADRRRYGDAEITRLRKEAGL
jgi:16S rRNA (guanine966-N2)-methyltransferase